MQTRNCLPLFVALLTASPAAAQMPRQTESDEYTRYELLAPESHQFKIIYEVTATTGGAKFFYNPIRKGSEASDEAVFDAATGKPLRFEVVGADDARANGVERAEADTKYIKIILAHPVPAGGEYRLRIDKIYLDPKSYYAEGDIIVFSRSLGIPRNSVILPKGYELIACNIPSQVLSEPDGRIGISFMNTRPDAAPLVVKGRPLVGAKKTSSGGAR